MNEEKEDAIDEVFKCKVPEHRPVIRSFDVTGIRDNEIGCMKIAVDCIQLLTEEQQERVVKYLKRRFGR